MRRRTFLAASAATLASTCLRPSTLFAQDAEAPPANLLTNTFAALTLPPSFHPFPPLTDRAAWQALPSDVLAALIQRADEANTPDWPTYLATDVLEFKRNGNRTHFEALSFSRRAKLGALVFGECATASGKYLDQIANGIWLLCEESFWGVPAHLGAQYAGAGLADTAEPIIELFSAETAATLALTTYLLGDALNTVSPLLLPRIQHETDRRIITPYLTRSDFSWMGLNNKPHHLNNWNPWINSNVLTAALLLEPDPARRSQLVQKICRSLDQFLADYSPDGACEEGPGYWSRSAAAVFDACSTLVAAHAGQGAAILRHPFLRAMGHYIAAVHLAGNQYVNYGDAHADAAPEPELVFRFGRATNDDTLAAFGAFLSAQRGLALTSPHTTGPASLSRELAAIFTLADIRRAPQHDALIRDAWYPHLGLMTARQSEGSPQGFYIALQAASNGRPHGHNDSGSFLLYLDGQPIFVDPGVEAYTAQTFSKDRYKLWTMQSAFHNLPTIGATQQHEGDAFRASDLHYEATSTNTTISTNLATAYPREAGLLRWTRTLTLNRASRTVELHENFAVATAQPITLNLICAHEPNITPNRIRIGAAQLTFDSTQLRATAEPIPLEDPGLRSAWGENLYRLQLTTTQPTTTGDYTLRITT